MIDHSIPVQDVFGRNKTVFALTANRLFFNILEYINRLLIIWFTRACNLWKSRNSNWVDFVSFNYFPDKTAAALSTV